MAVVILPYVEYTSRSYGTGIYGSYDDAHDAPSGTNPGSLIELLNTDGGYNSFAVGRGFLSFLTNGIPNTVAFARVYIESTNSWFEDDVDHADIHICTGHQSTPVVNTDFGGAVAEATLGSTPYPGTTPGSVIITDIVTVDLDAGGIAWLNLGGTTLFTLRISGDLDYNTPTAHNHVYFTHAPYITPGIGNATNIVLNSATLNSAAWLGVTYPQLRVVYTGSDMPYPKLYFKYGKTIPTMTTETSKQTSIDIGDVVTADISGLDADTLYYFALCMDTDAVTTIVGNTNTFTTLKGKEYPTNPITRVTSITHVYNRYQELYKNICGMGGVMMEGDTPTSIVTPMDKKEDIPATEPPVIPELKYVVPLLPKTDTGTTSISDKPSLLLTPEPLPPNFKTIKPSTTKVQETMNLKGVTKNIQLGSTPKKESDTDRQKRLYGKKRSSGELFE